MTYKITSAVALSAVLFAGACTDPGTLGADADPNKNTKSGALFGGIVGAGLAIATGAEGANILLGAAAGAAAGGLIGNNLDKQAADLRAQLANDGITVVNTGDRLVVTLPQDITFDTDSAAVRPSLRADLGKVATNLLNYPNSNVQVIGHTDNTGDATYNLGLSQERANSVADVLQAGGVGFNRIEVVGRGEEQPIASNLTPEGRAQNRRVEIVVIPKDS